MRRPVANAALGTGRQAGAYTALEGCPERRYVMRKMLSALAAALAVAGGAAAIAGAAQAQPYGYYDNSGDYAYRYAPPREYDGSGRYKPYSYYNGYDGYDYAPTTPEASAAIGAAMATAALGHTPYDQYGADPNGVVAPDGHQIKCKLVDEWNDYADRYVKRRVCW